jgi:hypothetical protein
MTYGAGEDDHGDVYNNHSGTNSSESSLVRVDGRCWSQDSQDIGITIKFIVE